MIVALQFPHNDGRYAAIIDGPGFDSGTEMVDGYEVDASVKSFESVSQAEDWLRAEFDVSLNQMDRVVGGYVFIE